MACDRPPRSCECRYYFCCSPPWLQVSPFGQSPRWLLTHLMYEYCRCPLWQHASPFGQGPPWPLTELIPSLLSQ